MSAFADMAKQGVGGALSALDLLTSLKSGQLGQRLLTRQAALQDPAFRDSVSNSPLMSGFLGLGGERSLQPVDAAPGGPSLPDREMQFRANLPPLGEAGQLELAKTRLGNQKTEAEIPLLQSQVEYNRLFNRVLGGGGGPSDTPGATEGALGGRRIGRIGMTPRGGTIDFPEPKIIRAQSGTFNDKGKLYRTGDVGPLGGGDKMLVGPGGRQSQTGQNRLNMLDTALTTLAKFREPIGGEGTPRPIDALTNSPGRSIASKYLPLGPVSGKGNLDILAEYAGKKPEEIPPAIVAANGGDATMVAQYATAAARLKSLSIAVVIPIRKALGDTANAAVQEQLMTLEANSVTGDETVGRAEEKLRTTEEVIRNLREIAKQDPSVAAALGVSQAAGISEGGDKPNVIGPAPAPDGAVNLIELPGGFSFNPNPR